MSATAIFDGLYTWLDGRQSESPRTLVGRQRPGVRRKHHDWSRRERGLVSAIGYFPAHDLRQVCAAIDRAQQRAIRSTRHIVVIAYWWRCSCMKRYFTCTPWQSTARLFFNMSRSSSRWRIWARSRRISLLASSSSLACLSDLSGVTAFSHL